jgi:hypothetical protein
MNSYKDTYYAGLARLRIEELKKQQEAAELAAGAAKKKADEEARARAQAEQQRLAMLEQQKAEAEADAKRKAEMEAETKAKAHAEAEAKKKAEDAELKRLATLQTEVDRKKAEPQDTHGLLGTWKCKSIGSYYKNGAKSGKLSCSNTLEIERFDGEYYWASARGTCATRSLDGTAQRRNSSTGKTKWWFVGEKLMSLLYSSSIKNDPGLNETFEHRLQNGKLTRVDSLKTGEFTVRFTVVCTK